MQMIQKIKLKKQPFIVIRTEYCKQPLFGQVTLAIWTISAGFALL